MTQLTGYWRPDGKVGIRNHFVVLSSVVCANRATELVAAALPGTIGITHQHGCAQIGADMELVFRTLEGIGKNPNVGGVLVLGLGCESIESSQLAAKIAESGKPVEALSIQKTGGVNKTVQAGIKKATAIINELSKQKREPFGWDKIIFGTECGGSDTTSGLVSNPMTGGVSDRIVNLGGTVILSETPEMIGAEHILARRGATPELQRGIIDLVNNVEKRYLNLGVSFRGGNPSPGNIEGGLTTLEEKSLGALYKGGTTLVNEILDYGQVPSKKGLVIMDTPGHDVESLTGMAAGGAQVSVFTTGRGTPTGSPICPIIKVTGNPQTWAMMADDIDINGSTVIEGIETLKEAEEKLFKYLVEVINGQKTCGEVMGHREFGIARLSMSL